MQRRKLTLTTLVVAAAGSATAALGQHPVWNAGLDADLFLGTLDSNSLFGSSVAIGPDVDNDMFSELVVGSPAFDGLFNNTGKATLFSGFTGSEVRTFGSTEEEALSGRSVLARRVSDGMGGFINQVLVGSPYEDVDRVRDVGSVLMFDASTGSGIGAIPGQSGPAANHGNAMAFLGDLNGDGVPEIGVGAPNVDLAPGQVVVFNGATLAPMGTLHGEDPFGGFGSSIGNAGDVNGDGTPDIIVGEPIASFEAGPNPQGQPEDLVLQARGQAFIFSGTDFVLIRRLRRPVEDRSAQGAAFGTSVDGIGDLNGDGRSEVVVGTPDAVGFVGNPGNAYVFDGMTGNVIYRVDGEGPASAPHWGTVVRGVGDLDGDMIPDFAVSGTELPLRSFFPAGPGRLKVYSGVNGLPSLEIVGELDFDAFGIAFDVADINSDGVKDFLVGAEGASFGSGQAYVFWGQALTVPVPPCDADRNGDQIVNVFDLLDYLALWFEGDPSVDLNGDLVVDVFDLLDYLSLWFTGC